MHAKLMNYFSVNKCGSSMCCSILSTAPLNLSAGLSQGIT